MSTSSPLSIALGNLDAGTFLVGFAQSPGRAEFVRRDGVVLTTRSGPLDLDWIYDLRVFSEDAEFHWWWDQDARDGRHAILDDAAATGRGWEPLLSHPQRLVRGTVTHTTPEDGGWSRLHDGHSRPLWIPFQAQPSRRVGLGVVEYVRTDERHGNCGVVAERFTGFKEVGR